jgi:hypothetical protein
MTEKGYCCKNMGMAIENDEVPISYNPIVREYGLNLLSAEIKLLYFCPWCSTKLPVSLNDEFFEILKNEYHIDDNFFEILKNPKLPNEFKSDIWWKKRNL